MPERRTPDEAWDSWVESSGNEGDFLQTSTWAAIDEAANGVEPTVIRVSASVAGVVGHDERARELRCLHGPVLRAGHAPADVLTFLEDMEALGREQGCHTVRLVGRPATSAVDRAELRVLAARRGFDEVPWSTSVVDLRRTDDELLAAADRAVRKAIRRCEREGITVRSCDDAATVESVFLAAFSSARPDYDPERGRITYALDHGRHYRYFVAEDRGGEVLATLGTYRFGGVATEIMSVRTAAGRAHGAPAQDLLHWQVLREHRALGDAWFDLAGYAPAPANAAEAGIRRFKEKWGGEEVASPIHTKSLRSRARRLARRLAARPA